MKKDTIIILTIVGALILILGIASYGSPKQDAFAGNQLQSREQKSYQQKQSADKVQVFVFHATQRCISCIKIGKFAKETIDESFQQELKDGKIEFREINIDLPENRSLTQKFQASGSALFINAIRNGQDDINEDVQVWRLVQNEAQFKSYLKGRLDILLGK
jgi:disulfide oxidoreductase YuzD